MISAGLVFCLVGLGIPALPARADAGIPAASAAGYEMKFDENDKFELMGNADGSIAVLNKENGFLYESNPQTEDELASGLNATNLKSQLYLTYADSANSSGSNSRNSAAGCVNKGWLTYEKLEGGGVRYCYEFQDIGIMIPVEYRLNSKGLTASVVMEDVREDSEHTGYYLMTVSLLPFFGAADTEKDGYILVPDGSGALIYFNNDKASYGAYSQYVYGRDNGLVTEALTAETETARMPVFGITDGTDGYLAVITQGDTDASVNAMTSGAGNSYNNVYASFTYRVFTISTFLFGTGSVDTTNVLTLSEVENSVPAYSVDYMLLSEEELTYVDMAKAYRSYLVQKEGLSAKVQDAAPFYLELLGGLEMEEYVLGVQVDVMEPLTTFAQAEEILRELKSRGVDDLAVKYSGWQKGGLEGRIPGRITFEGKLGGKSAYGKLAEYADANGIRLFMDFDFVNLYEGGNGFSVNRDAVQTVNTTPAYQYTYDRNLLTKNERERWKLLTPIKVQEAFHSMLGEREKLEGAGIALSTLGNMLYTDYSHKGNAIVRSDTKEVWKGLFREAAEQFGSVMADDGNIFTAPYVTHIYNVPVNSSQYDIEDEDVPFYQIVLHGYVSYSTEPLNLNAVPGKNVLKAVETGSSLAACLMYADSAVLTDSKYNSYFSSYYGTWAGRLAEYYEQTSEILKLVAQAQIEEHEEAASDVYCTVYSNGIRVYVNYNTFDADVDGVLVPAEGFVYVREG